MILGAILLLIAAAVLVGAELFLPSHGILGILAIICAVISVLMAARVSPVLGLFFGVLVIVISPLVFYYAVKLYPKSPMGRRVMLAPPKADDPNMLNDDAARLQKLVGERGVAMTMLRPSGSVELNGERIDCVSESEIIYPNTPVEVIRVSGLKVIVKPIASVPGNSAQV